VETFSIGFDEPGYDESKESMRLADSLGVQHHVEILAPLTFEKVQSILQGYDQPFGDAAAIPTYLLSRVARQSLKVVLSGDGGDEAFGGYERYRLMLLAGSLPPVAAFRLLGHALTRYGSASMPLGRIAGRALVVAASRRAGAYASLMAPFEPGSVDSLIAGVQRVTFDREKQWLCAVSDVSAAAQAADLTSYLPDCLTTKVDIASMAHSLEVRAPFLDHRLIEIGLALPRRERIRLGQTKVLLRRIASRRVGTEVARRRKRGFGIPLDIWLRGSMQPEASDFLLGGGARLPLLLDTAPVRHEVSRFFAGDRSRYFRVWTLLALEAWLRGPLGRRAVA
jgi:asparagine synthase (glutamine-hydrolysing)